MSFRTTVVMIMVIVWLIVDLLGLSHTSDSLASTQVQNGRIIPPADDLELGCSEDAIVILDIESFAAALNAAKTNEERQELLSMLGVEKLPPALVSRLESAPVWVTVSVHEVNLSGAAELDRVVELRFEVDGDEGQAIKAFRVQVLRPLGGNCWCAMSRGLSFDQMSSNGSNDYYNMGYRQLSFVNLTHAERMVMRFDDSLEFNDGTHTGFSRRVSYYEVQGGALVNIFSIETEREWRDEYSNVIKRASTTLQLGDDVPKVIVVQKRVECYTEWYPDSQMTCSPQKEVVGYYYRYGRYYPR